MGLNMTTPLIVGIEIAVDHYFEKYQTIPDWAWCDHRDKFGDDTQFCPTCGKKRPEPRTFTRAVPDNFPPEFINAVQKELGDTSFEDEINHPRALESVLGNLSNGLAFLSNDGEGCDDPHYYLGEQLASTHKWEGEVFEEIDFVRFSQLKNSIELRARDLGFAGEAKIVFYNWWG